MNEKKDKKGKHLETTIGKIIYGFLLFAPLLAVLTTCLYSTFNDNAYKSYDDKQVKNQITINAGDTLQKGITYNFVYNGSTTYNYNSGTIAILDGQTNIRTELFPNENWTPKNVTLTYEAGRARMIVYDTSNIQHNKFNWWTEYNDTLYFVNENEIILSNINTPYFTMYYNTYDTQKLDNAFYYGLEKAENSTLFNWSKNTAIYTILSTTCVGLGITNTFTPFLMAYWLIISVIYFIYDIGLMLVMVMHRKIHEMQEGI